MTFSIDEAIASLQPLLQAEHLVADGFHLVEVRPEDGEILVRFRWSRNRHVFGIKLDLSDPSVGLTGERIRSADQWAGEVFWRLEEERNTGYFVRAERRRMADYIELNAPPGPGSARGAPPRRRSRGRRQPGLGRGSSPASRR